MFGDMVEHRTKWCSAFLVSHRTIYFGLDVLRPNSIRNERRNALFPRLTPRDPDITEADIETHSQVAMSLKVKNLRFFKKSQILELVSLFRLSVR